MDLSVVVPVRNEVENVEPLLREIIAALHGRLDFEVVFVDDGSDDGTAQLLGRLKSEIKALRVVRHSRSCGQSTAVHTGVNVAQGAWIATLDGDGQNDPADIPKLLQQRHESTAPGLQMVCGFRAKRQDTWLRRLSSRVANGVRSRLLNDASIDTGCGLKLFRRDAFLHLPYFDHMHRFLPALVLRQGGRIAWVEVHHRPRLRGQSKYGLFDRLWVGIVDMLGVMWLQRRAKQPEIFEEN